MRSAAIPNESSPRARGPLATGLGFAKGVCRSAKNCGRAVWVPCFRRDDIDLHGSPEPPWREFGTAEVKALALGRLSRGGLQHQVENALPALLHCLLAVEDGAAIDVHVVFHALEHRRVGRKLDRGRGLAAEP